MFLKLAWYWWWGILAAIVLVLHYFRPAPYTLPLIAGAYALVSAGLFIDYTWTHFRRLPRSVADWVGVALFAVLWLPVLYAVSIVAFLNRRFGSR